MPVSAIVGANWGDEGKGKMTDALAAGADCVVRFQGGNNAGHTVINEYGKFVLHLLPSGVFRPHVMNVLGPGVAVNVPALLKELRNLKQKGIPDPQLRVSDRAQIVMPYHIRLDECEETRLGAQQFGSTQQGIAPFYADKATKLGIQVGSLDDEDYLRERLGISLQIKNTLFKHLYRQPEVQLEEMISEVRTYGAALRPYVCDTTALLNEFLALNKNVILEGQLGTLRDVDHGIYPYTTSCSPLAGFASVGAGIPACAIQRVLAVVKAYSSCVGAGPFVTEIHGDETEELRRLGGDDGEFGATTGRPRRMGWFDAVATSYGCRLQGATEVVLSLLDVLGYRKSIPICVAYDMDGKRSTAFPNSCELVKAQPIYEQHPGWCCDIGKVRDFNGLPPNAQSYIRRIEQLIGVPIRTISVGSHRDATLSRQSDRLRRTDLA
jgi:adenylosuccinate synthase